MQNEINNFLLSHSLTKIKLFCCFIPASPFNLISFNFFASLTPNCEQQTLRCFGLNVMTDSTDIKLGCRFVRFADDGKWVPQADQSFRLSLILIHHFNSMHAV